MFPVARDAFASLGYSDAEARKRVLILAKDADIPQELLAQGWVGIDRLVPRPSLKLPERFDGPAAHETAALYFSSGEVKIRE